VLATTVVSGLYLVISPLFNVMYPRFTALVAAGDTQHLESLYRAATRLLAICLFPLALLLAVLARQLVQLWTGNAVIAEQAAPIISVLAAGTALHGVMYLPYALQLAYGEAKMALTISLVLTATITPLLVFLATSYGPIGAAFAWLTLHVFYLFFGTWLTHRKLLPGTGMRWLVVDVGVPLLIAISAGALALQWLAHAPNPLAIQLAIGVALAGAAALLSLWVSPGLREEAAKGLGAM
jgi:O-antigen/teichoic acid export membrane protein